MSEKSSPVESASECPSTVVRQFRMAEGRFGMHSRPCAHFAHEAQKLEAMDVRVICGDERANAKSILDMMLLAIRSGDITVEIMGVGATQAAMDAFAAGIAQCCDVEWRPVSSENVRQCAESER